MENTMNLYNYTFHFHSSNLMGTLAGNECMTDITEMFDAVVIDTRYPHIATDKSKGLVWFEAGDELDFENKIITPLNRIHSEKKWEKIKVAVIGDINTLRLLAKFLNSVELYGDLTLAEINDNHKLIVSAMDIKPEALADYRLNPTHVKYQTMIIDPWIVDYVYAADWDFYDVPITTTMICTSSIVLNRRLPKYTLATGISVSKPSVTYSEILGKEYSLKETLKLAFHNAGTIFSFNEHINASMPPLIDNRPHHLRISAK